MMQYVNQNGQTITLQGKIGVGGEGAVYGIAGIPNFVAKIYHQPATSEKAAKLTAMAELSTPEILRFAAWPTGTLHQSRGGDTLGIILPRIKDFREIHELYSPAHRKVRFPRMDWRFLIRTARNCAVAFTTLHDHRIVIGDVNQGNLLVSKRAMVSLIDCDSFQVSVNGRLYRCPVGVAHFVPPELQGARLPEVNRTANHDNFGLATMIFHLLLMGRHPFSGRYSGPGDMPIEKAIRDYRFAYSSSAASLQMAPPPHSLTLADLPQEIGLLFERAFAKGSEFENVRPPAYVWAQALERLERQLCRCKDDPGHVYATVLSCCPWCKVMREGAPNFFISVTIQAVVSRSAAFDFVGIWARIQAVPRPDQVFTRAQRRSSNMVIPRPIPAASDEDRPIRNAVGIISAIGAALTLFAFVFSWIAVFSVPVCVVFAVWWYVLETNSPLRQLKRDRRRVYHSKTQDLKRAQANLHTVAQRYRQQFEVKLESMRQLKRTYEQLKTQRDTELHALQQNVRQSQMNEHLQRFFICDASISGIGTGRTLTLVSYGIETAYDIEEGAVMSVPGFREALTWKLMDWRRQKEHDFQFNPSKGIPQADIQALEMKYAQKRSQCERPFQRGPHELHQISSAAKAEVERLDSVVARLEYEAAQARADLRVFSVIP